MNNFKAEYSSFLERINSAQSMAEFQRLDKSLTRLYEAGIFTPEQFYDLDLKLMNKMV